MYVTIELPNYVENLTKDFTIQITPIYSGKKIEQLYTSEVINNLFNVYGENCEFFWFVQGKRNNINVEPNKFDIEFEGSKWIHQIF